MMAVEWDDLMMLLGNMEVIGNITEMIQVNGTHRSHRDAVII